MQVETKPQYMSALEKANETRYRRATLKEDVKAGRVRVADVIADPPEYTRTMLVRDLLVAQHRWGKDSAGRALLHIGATGTKQVGMLSPRRRDKLLELL